MSEDDAVKPSIRVARENWRRYPAPFLTKLRMAAANNWTKLRTRRDCCARLGEPGC